MASYSCHDIVVYSAVDDSQKILSTQGTLEVVEDAKHDQMMSLRLDISNLTYNKHSVEGNG
jgi:hypothetical protein